MYSDSGFWKGIGLVIKLTECLVDHYAPFYYPYIEISTPPLGSWSRESSLVSTWGRGGGINIVDKVSDRSASHLLHPLQQIVDVVLGVLRYLMARVVEGEPALHEPNDRLDKLEFDSLLHLLDLQHIRQ